MMILPMLYELPVSNCQTDSVGLSLKDCSDTSDNTKPEELTKLQHGKITSNEAITRDNWDYVDEDTAKLWDRESFDDRQEKTACDNGIDLSKSIGMKKVQVSTKTNTTQHGSIVKEIIGKFDNTDNEKRSYDDSQNEVRCAKLATDDVEKIQRLLNMHHKHSQTDLTKPVESENETKERPIEINVRCCSSDNLPANKSSKRLARKRPRYRRRKKRLRVNQAEEKETKKDEMRLFIVGVLQICAGAISIPLGIANFYVQKVTQNDKFLPSGIWCGIIFIVAGAQAIITSRYPSRMKAIIGLGLSILSSVSSVVVEILEIIAATRRSECYVLKKNMSAEQNALLCLQTVLALHVTLCGVVFTEIVISGVHTYYGFQVSKHEKRKRQASKEIKVLELLEKYDTL